MSQPDSTVSQPATNISQPASIVSQPTSHRRLGRKKARTTIKQSVKEYQACKNLRDLASELGDVSFADPDQRPLGWVLLHLHNTHPTDPKQGINYFVDTFSPPPMPMTMARRIARDDATVTEAQLLQWAKKRLRNKNFALGFIYIPLEPQLAANFKTELMQRQPPETTGNFLLDISREQNEHIRTKNDLQTIRLCKLVLPHDLLPNRIELFPFRKKVKFGLEINDQFVFTQRLTAHGELSAKELFDFDMASSEGEPTDILVRMVYHGVVKQAKVSLFRAFLLCRTARSILESSDSERLWELHQTQKRWLSRRYGFGTADFKKASDDAVAQAKLLDQHLEMEENMYAKMEEEMRAKAAEIIKETEGMKTLRERGVKVEVEVGVKGAPDVFGVSMAGVSMRGLAGKMISESYVAVGKTEEEMYAKAMEIVGEHGKRNGIPGIPSAVRVRKIEGREG